MSEQTLYKQHKLWWAKWFTVMGVILLMGLGTWQVARLQQKLTLIHTIEERVALPPVTLPYDQKLDLREWQYRRVIISGEFIYDKERNLYMGPKEMRGEIGYDLLTPLRLSQKHAVLVDRGWVPEHKKLPSQRPETLISGNDVPVIGMVQRAEKPGLFTPVNDAKKNIWFWIDVLAMLDGVGHEVINESYYIREIKHNLEEAQITLPEIQQAIWPIKGEVKVRYRNDHLQYAITWYSLAVILIIVYVAFRRQYGQDKS